MRCSQARRPQALRIWLSPVPGLPVMITSSWVELVDAQDEPALEGYHLLPALRGDLPLEPGRADAARVEFERAASLTQNERERSLLMRRADACVPGRSR